MHLLFKLISKIELLFCSVPKILKLPARGKHGAGQFIDFGGRMLVFGFGAVGNL